MTRTRLFPFPRLSPKEVKWSEWKARVDERPVPLDSIADEWDASSTLTFSISVLVDGVSMERFDIKAPLLALTATCADAASGAYADSALSAEGSVLTASAQIEIHGRDVSQLIDLRADVLGRDDSDAWLMRRILAYGPTARVSLASELDGFPTSSFSFDQKGIPAAPWRLVVSADSLDAPFAHSIRLELNEDYPLVRELIDGKPKQHVGDELVATTVRVLISTAARLSDTESPGLSPDDIAAEFPDSIAAAAQRAARQYLKQSLTSAVRECRLTPHALEYAVASGAKVLGG